MMKKPIGVALAIALAAGMIMDRAPWYRRMWRGRSGATSIRRGKYARAHQGEQECARRRSQIERGIIPKNQCL